MSLNVSGTVGVVSWAPHDTPRRGISADDMRAAMARRNDGQGWQTIANILGVNVLQLRIACKDPTLDPAFLPAGKTAPPGPALRRPLNATEGRRRMVLEAVAGGAVTATDIFSATNMEIATIYVEIAAVQEIGLLRGTGRTRTLQLTDRGRAWLQAHHG